jgi:hypothetical protein
MEYLINSGSFNIIVIPGRKQYFIINDEAARRVERSFVSGDAVDYGSLTPLWFQYEADAAWTDFQKNRIRLHQECPEADLIDRFVLKRFNFGSLVATRDPQSGKVRVFKRGLVHGG